MIIVVSLMFVLTGCSAGGETAGTDPEAVSSSNLERDPLEPALRLHFAWNRSAALATFDSLRAVMLNEPRLLYHNAWALFENREFLKSIDLASIGGESSSAEFSGLYDLLVLNFFYNISSSEFSMQLDHRTEEEVLGFKKSVLGQDQPEREYLKLALTYAERGDTLKGIENAGQSIHLLFTHADSHRLLAELAADVGDFRTVMIGYVFALLNDPRSPHDAYFRRKLAGARAIYHKRSSVERVGSEMRLADDLRLAFGDTGRVTKKGPLQRALDTIYQPILADLLALDHGIDDVARLLRGDRSDSVVRRFELWRDRITLKSREQVFALFGLREIEGGGSAPIDSEE